MTHWATWYEAAGRSVIDAALRDVYRRLDDAVQARGPVCWASGRCCNFDKFDHRLYVTGLEIAWMLAQVEQSNATDAGPRLGRRLDAVQVDPTGACPFQVSTLCTVHAVRPLGCRIFFCQQGTEAWQGDLYEQFLAELRSLHDEHALPYAYMEWRGGLREALAAKAGSTVPAVER